MFIYILILRGRRGHDRMVVGLTTTYETSAYHPGQDFWNVTFLNLLPSPVCYDSYIWVDLILCDTFMVLNATFNTISVISWRSVLLVEETKVPGENHRPA
jgi:hypothetical protein